MRVVDRDGRVLAEAQQPLRAYQSPASGQHVHPGDDLWESVVAATRAALARFDGDPSELIGVGLCTIRFCRALLDSSGQLLEPVWSWMDERVAGPHDPASGAAFVTTSSGYITHRLTGARRDSVAHVEGAWPLNPSRTDWADSEALRAWGVQREQLFDLVAPGSRLGELTPEAASATGLPAGLAVFATANDKAVEALGSGLISERDLVLSLGTYVCALALQPTGQSDKSDAYWLNAAALPGERLVETAGVRRGMWTVSWLRDRLNEGGGNRSEPELSEAAEREPIGAGGLVTLLDWLPELAHPERRGTILGFDGSQSGPAMFRSVLEAIAVHMREHVDAAEAALGRRFDRVIVSGGGSRSELMMRIIANVFDRVAVRCDRPDAVGTGAAVCAFVGAGEFASWAEAVASLVHEAERFEPEPEAVEAYRTVRERYARAREHADRLYAALAEVE